MLENQEQEQEQEASTAPVSPSSMGQRLSMRAHGPSLMRASQTGRRSMNSQSSVSGGVSGSGLGVRVSSAVSKLRLAAASFLEREPSTSNQASPSGGQTTSMRLQTLANQVVSSEAVLRQLEEAIAMSRATQLHQWTESAQGTEPNQDNSDAGHELGPWAGSQCARDRPARPRSTRPGRSSYRAPMSAHRVRARALRAAASVNEQAGAATAGDTAGGVPAADAVVLLERRSRAAQQHASVFKFSAGSSDAQPAAGPPVEDGTLESALNVTRMRLPVQVASHDTGPATWRSTEAVVVQATVPGQLLHSSAEGAAHASPRHAAHSSADAGMSSHTSPVDGTSIVAPDALRTEGSAGDVGRPRAPGTHCHMFEFELPRPPTGRPHTSSQGGRAPPGRADSGSYLGAPSLGPVTHPTGHPPWRVSTSGRQSPARPGSPLPAPISSCKQQRERCYASSPRLGRGWSSELAGPGSTDLTPASRFGGHGRWPSAPAPVVNIAGAGGGGGVPSGAASGGTGSAPHTRPRSPAEPCPLTHMSSLSSLSAATLALGRPGSSAGCQTLPTAAATIGDAALNRAAHHEPSPPGPHTPPSSSQSPRWAGYLLDPALQSSSNSSCAAVIGSGHVPSAHVPHTAAHASELLLPAVASARKGMASGSGAAGDAAAGTGTLGGLMSRLAHQPFWLHPSTRPVEGPSSSPASMTAATHTRMTVNAAGKPQLRHAPADGDGLGVMSWQAARNEDSGGMAASCTHECSQGKPLHPATHPSSCAHTPPAAHPSTLLRPATVSTPMRSRSGGHSTLAHGLNAGARPGSSLTRLLRASVESLQQLVPRGLAGVQRPQASHGSWSAGGAGGHGVWQGNSHVRGHGGHGDVGPAHIIHVAVGSGVGSVAPITMGASGVPVSPARFAWTGRQ